MSFAAEANSAQITWKAATELLPDGAREAGPYRAGGRTYPFCLPWDFVDHNLLPDVREVILAVFARDGIAWHQGTTAGPTSHLRSSQIQCLNALGSFVKDANGLASALQQAGLDVVEVLRWSDDLDDHVVFEWIGAQDYLGERTSGSGVRGANTTSSDAAVRYRTSSGSIEIVLIEWKYTETYRGDPLSGGAASNDRRKATYQRWWSADGPLRLDLVDYDDLFAEPIYQLWRLQLLAHEMERAREGGAEVVRLLVAAPGRNEAYWSAVPGGELVECGRVDGLWKKLLRQPDRFAVLDTAWLVGEASPCPDSFKARYAHMAVAGSDPVEPREPDEPAETSVGDLISSAQRASAVANRVFGEGGVVEQMAALGQRLENVPSERRAELRRRLEEIGELSRRLRADEIFEVLHREGDDA